MRPPRATLSRRIGLAKQLDEVVEQFPDRGATPEESRGELRKLQLLAGAIAAAYARRRGTAF
jgi:hypothetical protein